MDLEKELEEKQATVSELLQELKSELDKVNESTEAIQKLKEQILAITDKEKIAGQLKIADRVKHLDRITAQGEKERMDIPGEVVIAELHTQEEDDMG